MRRIFRNFSVLEIEIENSPLSAATLAANKAGNKAAEAVTEAAKQAQQTTGDKMKKEGDNLQKQ